MKSDNHFIDPPSGFVRVNIMMIPAGILLMMVLYPLSLPGEPLTLEDCIARALRQNADVLIAEQGIRRAAADVKVARADLLPSVNTTLFGYTRARTGPSIRVQENPTGEVDPQSGRRIFREEETRIPAIDRNSFSFSASMWQNIYDGGLRRNAYKAARRDERRSEWNHEARRAAVKAAVKQHYFNVLKAVELVQVQEESLKLSERRLEEARTRKEVGAGTQMDVLRLQVALENAQAQLINGKQGLILARANLNYIMGEKITAALEIAPLQEENWRKPETRDGLAASLAEARAHNSSLQSLRESKAAAEYNLATARGSRHPQLAGSVSYSRNNEVFGRVYQGFDQNYRLNFGLSLTYGLLDWGIKLANIDRARAALETLRMEVEQHEREIELAVETAHLELVRLDKILEIASRTVELAQEDLRLAEERYQVGKARLLEVLDAQVGFIEARSNLVSSRYDLKSVEADLEHLLGGSQ